MTVSVNDTHTLMGVVEQMPKFDPLFLGLFFPSQVTFGTKEILFDRIKKGLKLAPFVSPMASGKANRQQGKQTYAFEPAYVKPTDVVEPTQLLKRRPGERIGGELSVEERRDAVQVDLLMEQEKAIVRREEWMAVQAVMTGKVEVSGEDYATQEVDFGRKADNYKTVTAASRWDKKDQDTFDPTGDIEKWATESTSVPSLLVLHPDDWAVFSAFKAVKEKLDTRLAGNNSELALAPQLANVVQYKGNFGAYRCVVYAGKYEQDDGTKVNYMPKGKLLIAPQGYEGVRAYGAIQDAKAAANGMVETSRHPSNWFTDNPSVEWLQTQSAPLMVTPDPDEFVVAEIGAFN